MTRPWTPPFVTESGEKRITVKRTCESCFRPLGDVTPDELAAAVAGEPLPPVADECGCGRTIEQLALLTNQVDHHESGTVLWENLGEDGRDSYLADARLTIRALVHLGWAPLGAPHDTIPTKEPV